MSRSAASRVLASSPTPLRTTANSSLPTRATVVESLHDDRQPARHLLQKQVAVVVPERRVHLLEAIDVEDDHCDS